MFIQPVLAWIQGLDHEVEQIPYTVNDIKHTMFELNDKMNSLFPLLWVSGRVCMWRGLKKICLIMELCHFHSLFKRVFVQFPNLLCFMYQFCIIIKNFKYSFCYELYRNFLLASSMFYIEVYIFYQEKCNFIYRMLASSHGLPFHILQQSNIF